MTLEQLRIFVAVAERQHVTRAAEALHLTQSAVSGAIAALETRHAVQLFDRVGRNVVLNPAGAAFLEEARAVLARAGAAETALEDLAGLKRGRLSIHASQTICAYWLPSRLAAFHAAHPGVAIETRVGNTAEVARAVREGAAELGFAEGEVDDGDLSRAIVDSDEMVVVAAPGHALADRRDLSATDLLRCAWVLREQGSGTRSVFEAALRDGGVDPADLAVVLTLPGNEAVANAVAAGAGASALSASVAAGGLATGRLQRLDFRLPARPYYLLRHPSRYRSRAADAFLTLAGAR
jgi:DNA-binding transcriptional LysR family regulator